MTHVPTRLSRHTRHLFAGFPFALASVGLSMLAACGKVVEAGTQKTAEAAAEKAIQTSMQNDGAKDAKVDLSSGAVRATVTDKEGKQTAVEFGHAKVGEGDIGVPFYPGASIDDSKSNKVVSGDGSMAMVGLQSADKPEQVAGFYRDKLKAASAGKQFMEVTEGEGKVLLMLADDKNQDAMQVHVEPAGPATVVTIIASRKRLH